MADRPALIRDRAPSTPAPMRFVKMHGCGNDFVVLDARPRAIPLAPGRVRALADRRRGIGCDQLIVITPGPGMAIWNADGSPAGACGNAARCVAFLLAAETGAREINVLSPAGPLACAVLDHGAVRADMGAPRFGWADIPLAHPADTARVPLPGGLVAPALSMGNPHVTLFVDDIGATDVAGIGARIEHAALFPDRVNVGFAQVLAPDLIRLRVWERGAGLTPACGTGACAALVNAHRLGLAATAATLLLDGGALEIAWNGSVTMTGPVERVFEGVLADVRD